MEDHDRLRQVIREKSRVTIRKKHIRDALTKRRNLHLDIQAHEADKACRMGDQKYKDTIEFVEEQLGLNYFDIQMETVYERLGQLKNHTMALDSIDVVVHDLIKNDLRLYRRLARLLYRQDPRNQVVLFFMVMYHNSRAPSIPGDDLNDIVMNIGQTMQQQEGDCLFYSALLLQVLYLSHPTMTHRICTQMELLPMCLYSITSISYQLELKQFLVLMATFIKHEDIFPVEMQDVLVDFMENLCVHLLKHVATEHKLGAEVMSLFGALCQVDKRHKQLVDGLNQVVVQGRHLEMVMFMLEKSLTDQNHSRKSFSLHNASYALLNLLELKTKSPDKNLAINMMQQLDKLLPWMMEQEGTVQLRSVTMLQLFISQEQYLKKGLLLLSPKMLKQVLQNNDNQVISLVLDILLRCVLAGDKEQVERLINQEVLGVMLDKTVSAEVETLLLILEVLQGLLAWQGLSIDLALEMREHRSGLLERLQDHPNEDVYQTTVAIMKQHFQWERQ